MANTFTSLRYHVVFSTKHRRRFLTHDIEDRVWSYLGGIARENGMSPIRIGGVEDHIHLIVGIPPTLAVSRAVQLLKGGSSSWIHETFAELRSFGWQDGYAAFTIGRSQIADTIEYVARQREHHHARTFEDEYLAILRKHEIEFDPRYVFD